MTDFTSDAPITRAHHAPAKREYYAYFGLNFLATFRNLIGYSIGPLGIHRPGLFLALSATFWSAVCIVVSGTIRFDPWIYWWDWYRQLPRWDGMLGGVN